MRSNLEKMWDQIHALSYVRRASSLDGTLPFRSWRIILLSDNKT